MPGWLTGGLLYGAAGFLIGIVLAGLRAFALEPLLGPDVAATVEFALVVALFLGVGLLLMKRLAGPWTTNTALNYGMLAAVVLLALEAPFSLSNGLSREAVANYLTNVSWTHGLFFPIAVIVMALGPAFATQKA
jgi:hypothetical protein